MKRVLFVLFLVKVSETVLKRSSCLSRKTYTLLFPPGCLASTDSVDMSIVGTVFH